MSISDRIPKVGAHRGVPLDDQQTEDRLAVVRRDIDAVFEETDSKALIKIAANPQWAPEARRFAAAKLQATHQIAADERRARPSIDLEYVKACVAGLDSQRWRDRRFYASMLDVALRDGREPVEREVPPKDRS
ncbi:hypothetical protein ABIA00_006194 [Bradyrhizobium ottawaense]|uniref:hypothetical protein n=1 Tax=Bradyrhizobium ottawaense TaxID=931866 RepID=UPI003837629E